MCKRDEIQQKLNPATHAKSSKWKCRSMCAVQAKLNAKNIQGILFLQKIITAAKGKVTHEAT